MPQPGISREAENPTSSFSITSSGGTLLRSGRIEADVSDLGEVRFGAFLEAREQGKSRVSYAAATGQSSSHFTCLHADTIGVTVEFDVQAGSPARHANARRL